jgi:hypothetical protein
MMASVNSTYRVRACPAWVVGWSTQEINGTKGGTEGSGGEQWTFFVDLRLEELGFEDKTTWRPSITVGM